MNDNTDVLISIKPKYATAILNGEKTVELRKRRPNIIPGAKVWIYATAPIAELKGYARLDRIVSASPASIWREFEIETRVSKSDYDRYFGESNFAYALVLSGVKVLENPLELEQMKQMVRGFHPPQFFCRLNGAVAEMRLNSRKFQT
jgi:predicted transcriptional regulator